MESIAEDLLGLSVREDDDLPVSGMLLPADREIWLNGREASAYPGRRRFTLAHEIGHWICQCLDGRGEPVMCRAEDVTVGPAARALEREANVFAAELLMPEREIRTDHERAQLTARRYAVSELALAWRLHSFGLAEPPRRERGLGPQDYEPTGTAGPATE